MQTLLTVENVVKRYPAQPLRSASAGVTALDGVNFSLQAGTRMAIVGASGSGKSTLAACLACIERVTSGVIRFDGREVTTLAERELREIRPLVQLVFQDPALALNPRFTVLDVLVEPWLIQGRMGWRERTDCAAALLDRVGLSSVYLERTPAELSGGQRQRLAIARALTLEPKLVILDEALSALDCSVQAQIANLLLDLNRPQPSVPAGPAMIFITHDIVMAARLAEEIVVMERGRVVERGTTGQIVKSPGHAATQALLACAVGFPSRVEPGAVR
jgi:ABC-type glutathione transport system ATPase component